MKKYIGLFELASLIWPIGLLMYASLIENYDLMLYFSIPMLIIACILFAYNQSPLWNQFPKHRRNKHEIEYHHIYGPHLKDPNDAKKSNLHGCAMWYIAFVIVAVALMIFDYLKNKN